jgi:hypothetical protein
MKSLARLFNSASSTGIKLYKAIYFQEDIRCYDGYPDTNAGKRIVNIKNFECDPKAKSSSSSHSSSQSGSSSVTHALLVILILLVIAVGALVVYYHREDKILAKFDCRVRLVLNACLLS